MIARLSAWEDFFLLLIGSIKWIICIWWRSCGPMCAVVVGSNETHICAQKSINHLALISRRISVSYIYIGTKFGRKHWKIYSNIHRWNSDCIYLNYCLNFKYFLNYKCKIISNKTRFLNTNYIFVNYEK